MFLDTPSSDPHVPSLALLPTLTASYTAVANNSVCNVERQHISSNKHPGKCSFPSHLHNLVPFPQTTTAVFKGSNSYFPVSKSY